MSRQTHSECCGNKFVKVQMPKTIDVDVEHGFLILVTFTLNGKDKFKVKAFQFSFGRCKSSLQYFALYVKIMTTSSARLSKSDSTTDFQPTFKLTKSTISTKALGLVRFQNKNKLIDLLVQSAIQRLTTIQLSMKEVGFFMLQFPSFTSSIFTTGDNTRRLYKLVMSI